MRKSSFIIFTFFVLLGCLIYNACGIPSGVYKFNSIKDVTVGNPMGPATTELLSAVCSILNRCSQAPLNGCLSGVGALTNLDVPLGLPSGIYPSFSSIGAAEQSGGISANNTAFTNCWQNINNLSCSSLAVGGAYNTSSSNPYSGVALMLSSSVNSCSGTFAKSFLYLAMVANRNSNNISVFQINPNTGFLTEISGSPYPGPGTSWFLAVDPTARFLYGTGLASTNLFGFGINSVSGSLTTLPGSPFPSAISGSVAVHPSGQYVYVVDNTSKQVLGYSINQSTGSLSPTGSSPLPSVGNISFVPSGQFGYVALNSLNGQVVGFSVNGNTGALTSINTVSAGGWPSRLISDPAGSHLYVENASTDDISIYNIDPITGSLSQYGTTVSTGSLNGIAIDPTGQFLYTVGNNPDALSSFKINSVTGGLTPIAGSAMTTGTFPEDVAVDPTGQFVYVTNVNSNTISAYKIDPSTGALSPLTTPTFTGNQELGPNGITVVKVPQP